MAAILWLLPQFTGFRSRLNRLAGDSADQVFRQRAPEVSPAGERVPPASCMRQSMPCSMQSRLPKRGFVLS